MALMLLISASMQFSSCGSTNEIDKPERKPDFDTSPYVDLGLSVQWASHNYGGNKPEDYGKYYCWGETSPNSTYTWSSYKWCNGDRESITKYTTNDRDILNSDKYDHKTTLEPADDVASSLGANWRTPTYEEIQELSDKCQWTVETLNGVNGYRVTGPSGAAIFLPFAGERHNGELTDVGTNGTIWSSTIPYSSIAWSLTFDPYFKSRIFECDRCEGYSIRPVYSELSFQTGMPSKVTNDSMVVKYDVEVAKNATIQERGICLSKDSNFPKISDMKVKDESNEGGWSEIALTNLEPCTKYWYRPYGMVNNRVTYGEVKDFTTYGKTNGILYVDLGLSVKWAICNLGASTPTENKSYYAWGVTNPVYYFDSIKLKWCKNDNAYSQKNDNSIIDSDHNLLPSHDAATAALGAPWRMPTEKEIDELFANCEYKDTYKDGVFGYKLTSYDNGRSIFLPATGYYLDSIEERKTAGYYWSKTADGDVSNPQNLVFEQDFTFSGTVGMSNCGLAIRPVCP